MTARILIAEDDAIVASYTESAVRHMGYEVAGIFATGEEAVAHAARGMSDVVLMDIRLRGEMTGLEAAELIRKQDDIPIIFLTAYAETSLIEEAKAIGPYGYLVKPVHNRELQATIEMALYKGGMDRQLRHLNHVLRAMRDIGGLISRQSDTATLLQEACRILVGTRGYIATLIILGGGDEAGPEAIFTAGVIPEALRQPLGRELASSPFSVGAPAGKPVATAREISAANGSPEPWEKMAADFKARSVALVPLAKHGALWVFSDRTETFDAEELGVLGELAADLTFALWSIKGEAARRAAEDELRQSRESLRKLSSYLEKSREAERTRIAREVHDELGQILTALKMDIAWINDQRGAGRLMEMRGQMLALADEAIGAVQRIATDLRPSILDDFGLEAAIEWQVKSFAKRTGISVDLRLPPPGTILDRDRQTAMFRILQEALTNVARHAGATEVMVTLREAGDFSILEVTDNGRGISPEEHLAPASMGLKGMEERTLTFGGRLEIVGGPERGTTVRSTIPRERRKGRA